MHIVENSNYVLLCVQRRGIGYRQNSGSRLACKQFYLHSWQDKPHSQSPCQRMSQDWRCHLSNDHSAGPIASVLQFGLSCNTLFPQAPELIQALFVRHRKRLPVGHRLLHCCIHFAMIFVQDDSHFAFFFCSYTPQK